MSIMDIFKREERAVMRLGLNYRLSGLTTWPVDPDANVPYQIGVTFRPNKTDKAVAKQQERVHQLAGAIGSAYDLEARVYGPIWAAGGTVVVYVGLQKPSA